MELVTLHCPTLGGAISTRCARLWDLVGEDFFFRSSSIVLWFLLFNPRCLEKVIIHLLHPRDLPKSTSVCLDKFDTFNEFGGFGSPIALCCTSTQVARSPSEPPKVLPTFGRSRPHATISSMLPRDKSDFMEDGRWLHFSTWGIIIGIHIWSWKTAKKNIEETIHVIRVYSCCDIHVTHVTVEVALCRIVATQW